jgi:hypothetical protein
MKVVLNTHSPLAATLLKQQILKAVKREIESIQIDTWAYSKSKEQYDIIFHSPDQYTKSPEKNVIFRIYVDGYDVTFIPLWWKNNPQPAREMICLHVGRLVEMLFRYFSSDFNVCNIVEN